MARCYYTLELANRTLPLVRSIAESVRDTALEMEELWTSLRGTDPEDTRHTELSNRVREIQARFAGLLQELRDLGVELKDPFQGLVDFPAERQGADIWLCWRLGEDTIGHWHELEAGFSGRRPMDSF